ncbi:hypothetical protein U1Q18_048509 [Sarracenia purpurea var. burkii]
MKPEGGFCHSFLSGELNKTVPGIGCPFVVRGFRFSSSLVSTGCVLGSPLWFLDSGSRSLVRAISESQSLALWFSGFVVCRGSLCLWFVVFWFPFSDSLDRNPSFAISVRDSGSAILVRLLWSIRDLSVRGLGSSSPSVSYMGSGLVGGVPWIIGLLG